MRKGVAKIADVENWTPFLWTVKKGWTQVVLQFLEMNVDIGLKDKNEQTPLPWAADNGHEAVVRLLLKTGKVDVELKDKWRWTLLSRAATKAHKAVVKLLLGIGKASFDVKNSAN